MQEKERSKLFERTSEYLSIGITAGGESMAMIPVPWERTATAYNMHLPNVYILPEDLQDKEIMRKIRNYKVIGCYIWAPLSDYAFISDFIDLQDLYIFEGNKITNLDFLSSTPNLRMLFLDEAHLDKADRLVELNQSRENSFDKLKCVALHKCTVTDISAFETTEHYFMEFLVWESDWKRKSRWDIVNAAKKVIRKSVLYVKECDEKIPVGMFDYFIDGMK